MKFDRSKLEAYLKLYIVSDRFWLDGRELRDDIAKTIEGGVTFVQLREKELDDASFIDEAWQLKALCEERHIPFVINDNIHIAKLVDADGVHVGQSDASVIMARAMLGEDKIIGVSAQNVEDALLAQQEGADYIGVGAVFSTSTKKDADDVSMDTLKAITAAVNIPVIAIGGIDEHNVMQLKGSGIVGVAVISAILGKENIYQATQLLCKKTEEMLHV